MQTQPFSLATDASNDYEDVKLFPICVRLLNGNGQIVSVLLEIKELNKSASGENIFGVLDDALKVHKIPWKNCVSFSCDNASVMTGRHKGVASYIHKVNSSVYINGCVCHLMHLAADKAAATLSYCIEDLLIDSYYFLDKSSCRKQELKKFQNLCGVDTHKILKHVSTRWLSLGLCINRLINQYEPLKQYFNGEALKVESKLSKSKKSKSSRTGKPDDKSGKGSSVNKTSSQSKGVGSRSSEKSVSGSIVKPSVKSSVARSSTESVSVSGDIHEQPNKEFDLSSFTFKQGEIAKQNTISTITSSTHKSVVSSEVKDRSMNYASSKVVRIDKMLEDCNTKLYCLFLQNVIPIFDIANQLLQKDEPVIHLLHDVMINQLTDIFIRFLKPNTVTSAKSIPEVKFDNIDNQKDDKSLVIGQSARSYIESTSKGKLDVVTFYKGVHKFYCRSCEYMIKKTSPLKTKF